MTASASLASLNMKGVSKMPKSLFIPVRMPGPIIDISTVPPCMEDATTASPPSEPPA